MTNEDNAKKIANDLADCAKGEMNKLYVSTAAYAAAMKMAELKDASIKQYLQHGKEFAQFKGNSDLTELFEIIIEDLKL